MKKLPEGLDKLLCWDNPGWRSNKICKMPSGKVNLAMLSLCLYGLKVWDAFRTGFTNTGSWAKCCLYVTWGSGGMGLLSTAVGRWYSTVIFNTVMVVVMVATLPNQMLSLLRPWDSHALLRSVVRALPRSWSNTQAWPMACWTRIIYVHIKSWVALVQK